MNECVQLLVSFKVALATLTPLANNSTVTLAGLAPVALSPSIQTLVTLYTVGTAAVLLFALMILSPVSLVVKLTVLIKVPVAKVLKVIVKLATSSKLKVP